MNYRVKLDAPYPELRGKNNNNFYVSLLKNLYAGKNGELTAVLQYTYQTHFFEAVDAETADIILQIAIVEMEHMAQLAKAIIFFGGDPKYVSGKDAYFCTKSIDYVKGYNEMLLSDLEGEKSAIADYANTANSVNNMSLKQLLLRIKFEEEMHYSILAKLLSNVSF